MVQGGTVNPIEKPTKSFDGRLVRSSWFYKQWRLAGNPALFFKEISRDLGDFVLYRGSFQFYLINHPALVKQVLQETNDAFDKQSISPTVLSMSGIGLMPWEDGGQSLFSVVEWIHSYFSSPVFTQ